MYALTLTVAKHLPIGIRMDLIVTGAYLFSHIDQSLCAKVLRNKVRKYIFALTFLRSSLRFDVYDHTEDLSYI